MKKLFIILLVGLLSSCGTVYKGTDVAGNKVTVVRNNKGKIVKQIHERGDKTIILVYNR